MSEFCCPKRWLVVILTHNEASALIQTCLQSVRTAADALVLQDPAITVRIRIMDDSRPELLAAWQDAAAGFGIEVVYVKGTISEKRNAGCAGVVADIIAFTDADCEVEREWLVAHAVVYATKPQVPGVVGQTLHQADDTLAYAAARHAGFLIGFQFPEMMQHTLWGPCSNLSLRMDAFSKVGGFNEAFSYASEDVDIGLRICTHTGARLACSTAAPVRHASEPFAQGVTRRAWKWGDGEAILLSHHPERRIFAPPKLWMFLGIVLGWTITDTLICDRPLSLVCFAAVYLIGGPLQEACEAKTNWAVVVQSRIFLILFQLRTSLGLLRTGRLHLLATQMNYGEGQFLHEWSSQVRSLWEFLIFVLLIGVTLP